jgi:hypothetical protein
MRAKQISGAIVLRADPVYVRLPFAALFSRNHPPQEMTRSPSQICLYSTASLLAAAATTVAQQQPPQPVFDGTYTGTPVAGTGSTYCNVVKAMEMTIGGGQVTIRSSRVTGRDLTYQGTVTPVGEISATAAGTGAGRGRIYRVTGTIRGNLFTGDIVNNRCYSTVTLIKR